MDQKPTFFPTTAKFRRWLEANHETRPELLVGFWKKGSGKASIDWPQARDSRTVTPGLTRGPPAFALEEQGGCRIKSGMTRLD